MDLCFLSPKRVTLRKRVDVHLYTKAKKYQDETGGHIKA